MPLSQSKTEQEREKRKRKLTEGRLNSIWEEKVSCLFVMCRLVEGFALQDSRFVLHSSRLEKKNSRFNSFDPTGANLVLLSERGAFSLRHVNNSPVDRTIAVRAAVPRPTVIVRSESSFRGSHS